MRRPHLRMLVGHLLLRLRSQFPCQVRSTSRPVDYIGYGGNGDGYLFVFELRLKESDAWFCNVIFCVVDFSRGRLLLRGPWLVNGNTPLYVAWSGCMLSRTEMYPIWRGLKTRNCVQTVVKISCDTITLLACEMRDEKLCASYLPVSPTNCSRNLGILMLFRVFRRTTSRWYINRFI